MTVDYLIHPLPSYNRSPRVGAGAAIIAIFYLFLIPMLGTYIRLLYTVIRNPGYLPLGAERLQADVAEQDSKPSGKRLGWLSSKSQQTEKADTASDLERGGSEYSGSPGPPGDPLSLETFYTKDVFMCQDDGRPQYCSTCCQFKTDRAHHCREINRCVAKMDHFCPWYVEVQPLTFHCSLDIGSAVWCRRHPSSSSFSLWDIRHFLVYLCSL